MQKKERRWRVSRRKRPRDKRGKKKEEGREGGPEKKNYHGKKSDRQPLTSNQEV
jgi:hypothetical protein